MFQKRKNILKLANDFADKCDQSRVWYSLTDNTLLGIIRHGGFVPWSIKFEIIVTYKGFNRLRELFPRNIIDSFKNKNFKNLTAIWVNEDDYMQWEQTETFLEIRVVIPTTLKKLQNFYSKWNTMQRFFNHRKDNINLVIEKLLDRNNYEGYLELVNRKQDKNFYWHQSLTFERILRSMNGFVFKVSKDYNRILEHKYGVNYMKAQVPYEWYDYLNPIKKVKEW